MKLTTKISALSIPLTSPSHFPKVLSCNLVKPYHLDLNQAKIICIGDGSHGTEEFYKYRIDLTKKLIEEDKLSFIVIEANFPDTYRVNKFILGKSQDTMETVFNDFDSFPSWMWNNRQFKEFIQWIKDWNSNLPPEKMVGIYGMDLYSLFKSSKAVIKYLDSVDPEEAKFAKRIYGLFDQFHGNAQEYGYAISHGYASSREREIKKIVIDLLKNEAKYIQENGLLNGDEFFYAKGNAEVVKGAEEYYRKMYTFDENTWNIRDKFFFNTVCDILEHYEKSRKNQVIRCTIWAHNSHLGDARATGSSERGQWNIGQLLREKFNSQVFNIGCLSYRGTVTAADEWDATEECMRLKNGTKGSIEHILHESNASNFFLCFKDENADPEFLSEMSKKRLERYVGVIYRPITEKSSHYSASSLPNEFDAIVFFDESHGLVPIEPSEEWLKTEQEFNIKDQDQYPEIISNESNETIAQNLLNIALKLIEQNHLHFAELKFVKALKYTKDKDLQKQIYYQRALLYVKQKNFREALEDCRKVMSIDRNFSKIMELSQFCFGKLK